MDAMDARRRDGGFQAVGYIVERKKPWGYPLVICYIAIENGPVEIVDLPTEKW
jgi:hypothetical protein